MSNSLDPDQAQHLGQNCLQRTLLCRVNAFGAGFEGKCIGICCFMFMIYSDTSMPLYCKKRPEQSDLDPPHMLNIYFKHPSQNV